MKNSKKCEQMNNDVEYIEGHLALGSVADADMAALSCELDAALDKRWFQEHPGATSRTRPASVLELAASGAPPGTEVVVELLPSGDQPESLAQPPLARVSVDGSLLPQWLREKRWRRSRPSSEGDRLRRSAPPDE